MLDLLEDGLDLGIDLDVLVLFIHVDFVSLFHEACDPVGEGRPLHGMDNSNQPVPGQLKNLLLVRQLVGDFRILAELLQHLFDREGLVLRYCLDLDGLSAEI